VSLYDFSKSILSDNVILAIKNIIRWLALFFVVYKTLWSGICYCTQLLEDFQRVVVLASWTITDVNHCEEIGQEVMALTDQDGFVPGQIFFRTMPERRNRHGDFITG